MALSLLLIPLGLRFSFPAHRLFIKLFTSLFIAGAFLLRFLITTAMIAAIIIGELFAAGEVALIMAVGEL